MKEKIRAHIIVEGKVQGVGFRAFTEYHATQRGLNGWVRNCHDGTVEVEVEGPRPDIQAFLAILEKGPRFSDVAQIVVDWKDANRHTQGFTIRRN